MKSAILLTLQLTFLSGFLTAQLVNPGLTDWEIVPVFWGVVENPVGWMTNNEAPFTAVANSPVTVAQGDSITYARIESNFRSIDALGPGWLSQTISLSDLLCIDYRTQCDSLADKGYCLVEVLIAGTREQLYGDTIRTTSEEFTTKTISVPPTWRERTDSVTLKFTAYGNLFQLEPEEDAYAVFLVDGAQANYLMSATTAAASRQQLAFWPNPATDQIRVRGGNPECFLSVFDLGGRLLQTASGSIVNVGGLPPGTYVLRATDGSVVRTGKFIKH